MKNIQRLRDIEASIWLQERKVRVPVDDAMPERLPQTRLTARVESLGLLKEGKENVLFSMTRRKERQWSNMVNAIKFFLPLRKPIVSQDLINRKAYSHARSNSLQPQ